VPTSDGVEATIQGTFYLNTVFNNAASNAVKTFDTQFSTRTFGPDELHPYDHVKGYRAFLTAIVLPVAENNMRDVVAGVQCADLVSSCALVQNTQQVASKAPVSTLVKGKNNQANVQRVQSDIATGLTQDLKTTLGDAFFRNISFKLTKVTLPPKVQTAIDDAQSAFAQVSQSQARIASATADATANTQRQKGYNACPACRQIDAIRAWRGTGVTTVVNGGAAVSVGGKR
jgi:hypothetical protein